jgi:peroxiredoxin Q/BCP
LTASGYSIYGLSADSPKANTTFKTKQKLQYPLLCDPKLNLISAIGLKKAPSGTTRGVFVIDKSGKVLVAEPGSPDGTVAAVKKILGGDGAKKSAEERKENKAKAEVAADVADTAAEIDGEGAET